MLYEVGVDFAEIFANIDCSQHCSSCCAENGTKSIRKLLLFVGPKKVFENIFNTFFDACGGI
jgi:hypothetical protein